MSQKTAIQAVCHTCGHVHQISASEVCDTGAVRDWEVKHAGHMVEFVTADAFQRSIATHAVNEYRHNANVKLAYAASAAYTITLASLATSSTRVAGRESTSVSNSSNLYLDFLIAGKITTGTTPTVNEIIEVCTVAAINDTPTWPDVFDGTDSAETITSTNVKNGIVRYAGSMSVAATSDIAYFFGPTSLAQLYGVCPRDHVIFVTHSTAVNLHATEGNHSIVYTPVYATVI